MRGSAAVIQGPDWQREGWDWPHREHSRFVDAGGSGIRWHVQVMGSGPVVFLLHGTGASTHSFRAVMPTLARRFTVVAPDLPGHAFSRMPDRFEPTLRNIAGALGELLAALDVQPELAVGHSAGAALQVQMALDGALPARRIVALAGALVPFRGVGTAFFSPAARMLARSSMAPRLIAFRARDTRNVERVVQGTGSHLDARGVDFYRRLASNPGHIAGVLRMLAVWDLEPLFTALPRLESELLLVAGDRDRAVPLAQAYTVAAAVPRSRVEVVHGAGHLLHEEQPSAVARLILETREVDRVSTRTDDLDCHSSLT
ncbi:MAG: alpha/beta fold hydrolase BchO [Myxococcaceae bacterium]